MPGMWPVPPGRHGAEAYGAERGRGRGHRPYTRLRRRLPMAPAHPPALASAALHCRLPCYLHPTGPFCCHPSCSTPPLPSATRQFPPPHLPPPSSPAFLVGPRAGREPAQRDEGRRAVRDARGRQLRQGVAGLRAPGPAGGGEPGSVGWAVGQTVGWLRGRVVRWVGGWGYVHQEQVIDLAQSHSALITASSFTTGTAAPRPPTLSNLAQPQQDHCHLHNQSATCSRLPNPHGRPTTQASAAGARLQAPRSPKQNPQALHARAHMHPAQPGTLPCTGPTHPRNPSPPQLPMADEGA